MRKTMRTARGLFRFLGRIRGGPRHAPWIIFVLGLGYPFQRGLVGLIVDLLCRRLVGLLLLAPLMLAHLGVSQHRRCNHQSLHRVGLPAVPVPKFVLQPDDGKSRAAPRGTIAVSGEGFSN